MDDRVLEELEARFHSSGTVYYRKRWAWIIVTKGAFLLKRIIDIVLSSVILVLLFPFLLIIAFLIKRDGGPVLYVAPRVGKWGKVFPFPKFRTMRPGADKLREGLSRENVHGTAKVFKIKQDPRTTRIGSFMRKTSLDEIPQLWSVLKGDMTLVGPRPPLPEEAMLYTLEERRRLDVIPGITGLWQVSGRSDIPFDKQVRLDLDYINSQSVWGDIIILLKTIPAVLMGKGAY